MNILLYILQGGQVIGTLLPVGIELAQKLISIFHASGVDFVVQVTTLQEGSEKGANDALTAAAAWRAAHPVPSA